MSSRRSTPAGWPDRRSAGNLRRRRPADRSATCAGSSSGSTIASGGKRPATSDAGARGSRSANARAAGSSSSPRATPSASVDQDARSAAAACSASPTGVSVGSGRPGGPGRRWETSAGQSAGRRAAAARRPRPPRRTTPSPPRSRPAATPPSPASATSRTAQPTSRTAITYPPIDGRRGAGAAIAGRPPDARPQHPAAVQRQRGEQIEHGDHQVRQGQQHHQQPADRAGRGRGDGDARSRPPAPRTPRVRRGDDRLLAGRGAPWPARKPRPAGTAGPRSPACRAAAARQ